VYGDGKMLPLGARARESRSAIAGPGRALSVHPTWHTALVDGLTSIPLMQPGDAVFWHSDVVHSVEDAHNGDGYSSVMYIGGTVGCAKKTAYLPGQCASFLAGKTPPISLPTTSKSILLAVAPRWT
jgi:hypothetical protein